jgi:Antirestriction protein
MTNISLTQRNTSTAITATKVACNRRLSVLPLYFPNTFLVVESLVYSFAEKLCSQYTGALWEFYELSNGGFYMAPVLQGVLEVDVPFGNQYQGKMSADAFGITVCLFAYCYLLEQHPESDAGDFYWSLRDFASDHVEAAAIFSAID